METKEKRVFTDPVCKIERFLIEDIIATSIEDNWDLDEL